MALNIDIRPPTPDMKGAELHQWQQRIFEALQSVVEVNGGEVEAIDHNDLLHNGGVGSHNSIALHIQSHKAHGTNSPIVGESDEQTLTNKIIDADDNTLSNLKHGEEVDNPTSAHGTSSDIVGINDEQTLTNKKILRKITPVFQTPHPSKTGDGFLACQVSGRVSLPSDAKVGEVIYVDNASTGDVLVDAVDCIEGELQQTVPKGSCMVVCKTDLEWRIV